MISTSDGINRCNTNTAAYNDNGAEITHFRGTTQRTNNVQNVVAYAQGLAQMMSAVTDGLNNQGNSACLTIKVCNGQGHTLAEFVSTHNYKLTRLAFVCYERCIYNHFVDLRSN